VSETQVVGYDGQHVGHTAAAQRVENIALNGGYEVHGVDGLKVDLDVAEAVNSCSQDNASSLGRSQCSGLAFRYEIGIGHRMLLWCPGKLIPFFISGN